MYWFMMLIGRLVGGVVGGADLDADIQEDGNGAEHKVAEAERATERGSRSSGLAGSFVGRCSTLLAAAARPATS